MDGWKAVANEGAAIPLAVGGPVTDARRTVQGSVFMFQRRRVPINWRHLAGLDVDRVCREMDVQALQQNISNVTFCDVASEDFQGVDGNFIKLFRLAQLTIEYLLHSQQYLSDQKKQLEQQVQQLQTEKETCEGEAKAKVEEMKILKRENRKRRKMIEAYQDMLNHGATGLHPCPVCSKEFVSQQYLDSHIHRRHPDHLQPPIPQPKQGPTQEEIEKKLLEQMDERFHVAQQQLREELTRKENESLQSQALEFEQWKAAQQENRKRELEEMQTPLLEQLRAVEQEKEQLQKVLLKTQAMKKLTWSLHSEDPEPSGKVKKDERPTETADSTAVATDVKRLETKVVSKWKKHKKSVHRQMEEMNKSYQDQLLELSKKLASMEQSAKAQQFPKDKRTGKELNPKTTQQMHTQAQTVPAQQPTNANSQSEVSEGSEEEEEEKVEEEEEEEESDDESEGEGGREETDAPHFIPFSNRSNITTLFNHGQEAMEKIRRETANILDNALLQRGVTKGTVGMSDALLESKMKALQGERQKRIQMHYQFMEQRERLASEIELSAMTNCHFSPPRHLFPSSPPPPSSPSTRRSSPRRATSPFKTSPHHKTSPRLSSPQKHSPQRGSPNKEQDIQLSSPGGSAQQQSHGRVSTKPPTGLPAQAQLARSQQRVRASRASQTESSESETETESDSESYEEDNQPAAVNTVTVAPRKRVDNGGQGAGKEVEKHGQSRAKVPAGSVRVLPDSGRKWGKGDDEQQEEKDRGGGMDGEESSWDSEDSNEHLTTKDLMSVPTSTPVQVIPVKKAKVTKSGNEQDSQELSDNSWDVTEISSESQPHTKRTAAVPQHDTRHVKLASTHSGWDTVRYSFHCRYHSENGNSQSALTTVTRGDFDDSDLSDISTTQLT